MPDSNHSALRQTCNRCRELKVRCQSRYAITSKDRQHDPDKSLGPGVLAPCLRCARAGANCIYGSKQRSGRPRVYPKPSSPRPSASPPTSSARVYNPDFENAVWTLSPQEVLSPQSWLSQQKPLDPVATLINEQQIPSLFDNSVDDESIALENDDCLIYPEYFMDSTTTGTCLLPDSSGPIATPADSQLVQEEQQRPDQPCLIGDSSDPTVKNMRSLMDLNLRIYLLQHQAERTFNPSQQECSDVADVAQSFLGIITDRTQAASFRHRSHSCDITLHPSMSPPLSPGSDSLPRTNVDYNSKSTNNRQKYYEGKSHGMDAGTMLIIYSCYQRLLDLFIQICTSIQAQIQKESISCSASFTQAVMATELVSHLTRRIDRGLSQLLKQETRQPASSSRNRMPSLWPGEITDSALDAFSDFDNCYFESRNVIRARGDRDRYVAGRGALGIHGLRAVEHAIARNHRDLRAHIDLLKHSIEHSDRI
ncbi:hypothetical protein F5Y15DRAFT_370576 [Xylariaceae sp. FL0016]|nr:hypothetical protein F5Y15DRAFT_370576 [Xylariaceae sp. FL0016]